MLHHLGERHHPTLKSEPVYDWIENAVSRFSERLMQQLCKLPLKNQTVIGMKEFLARRIKTPFVLTYCIYSQGNDRSTIHS